MTRCKDCDSDLVAEELAECGGWCMGCAPSCGDCGATPALHPITNRGKPAGHVCDRCNRSRGPILRPTVISGPPFDWGEAAKASESVIDDDGEVNWRAAFNADPGVSKCPKCSTMHWWEGDRIRCAFAGCGHEWSPGAAK